MSGLLFLVAVCGFMLIAYWAYRNDGMKPDECGSGLLAMRLPGTANQKSVPKWKKTVEGHRRPARPEKAAKAPGWRRGFLPSPRR